MKNYIMFKIKKFIRILLNTITCYFLIAKTRMLFCKKTKKYTIAILGDYLCADFLFDSQELADCDVGFIVTKRYPFFSFLLKQRWRKLSFMYFVSDFGQDQFPHLLDICINQEVDLVLIQAGDFLVPAYNYLNSKLNDKGNNEIAVKCSLDKDFMRDTLNQNNISMVKKKSIHLVDDIKSIDFYPCVIKPNIGTASEGIVLVKSAEEMRNALFVSQAEKRNTEFTTNYLAEEYIEGRQFDVEGIIVNGKVFVLCIVEENYQGFFPYFNVNWFLFNAFVSEELKEKIQVTLQKAFEVSELKHGAYHCELRINATGEIKIIEFSNRMGGGFEASISKVTGNHFADLYIRSMLGKEITMSDNRNTFLLEKYFRDEDEYADWKNYLDEQQIGYLSKPWIYRGQVAVLKIYLEDKELVRSIGKYFNMDYIL